MGQGRMHGEPPGLISGRRHYATFGIVSNRNRLALQFQIVSLLHSGKELVNMDDLHL